ncbi:MAG: Rieske 2Fe-2S domain-containing protein, partial [Chromatiales bacterium]|nr:Rieske 2Fe-2S domain-containing protein [Chromatiales bacterium]
MLSTIQNNLVTQTDPGTLMGKLLRQHWQPVALSAELAPDRPVCGAVVMGTALVVFRDNKGAVRVMDRHCPHRGADLSYARWENGALRCPFHGWLFGANGQCLEQPAEPEDSRYHERIRVTNYPAVERNGMVLAYLGGGDAPALPVIDCLSAPNSHSFSFKGFMQCNWLQALEVGIDPAHASFLHRFLRDEDPDDAYGKQFRDNSVGTNVPMTRLLREHHRPKIDVQ